jgi:hypothetical protein
MAFPNWQSFLDVWDKEFIMPTATYIALANLTLTSSDASVEFTSIPDTYRDLVLVAQTKATGNTYGRVRVNGDTGSNYVRIRMFGNSGGASSGVNTLAAFDLSDLNTTDWNFDTLHFLDASATDKHKTVLIRSSQTNVSEVSAQGGRFASTSAITSITILTNSNAFEVGSTFALYGIVS